MSLFADNINQWIRGHRDVLGDIDFIPKIKLAREEQYVVN
jgi:hypothetical protein